VHRRTKPDPLHLPSYKYSLSLNQNAVTCLSNCFYTNKL
jgi:hypothetical protein